MSKQRVLITIGYEDYLLPDDAGAATIIKALSKAVKVWDNSYQGELILRGEHVSVGMKYVSDKVKLIDKDGAQVSARPSAGKAVKPPTLKLLQGHE
jgi:hypothetical protein